MRIAAAIVVAATLAGTTAAHADTDSYRLEVGAVDTATTGLLVASVYGTDDHSDLIYVTLAAAVLAPPIDHLAHGNALGAGLSVAAHLGLPVLGGAIGLGTADSKGLDALANLFVGAAIGHLAAVGVDIALAHADHGDTTPTPRLVSFGGHF